MNDIITILFSDLRTLFCKSTIIPADFATSSTITDITSRATRAKGIGKLKATTIDASCIMNTTGMTSIPNRKIDRYRWFLSIAR